MDISRPNVKRRRWIRRGVYSLIVVVILTGATIGLSRLEPAAPGVERSSLVIGDVKRGLMLLQVRGSGKLVPEESLWVTAGLDGRVERLPLQPGVLVQSNTMLVELSNPQLELDALNAKWAAKSAEAALEAQRAQLQNQALEMDASLARLESNHQDATLQHNVDQQLFKDELISERNLKLSAARVQQYAHQIEIERKRLRIKNESLKAELAVQEAAIEQAKALYELRQRQVEGLRVCAGVEGILEQVKVEVGQRVPGGTVLAKVTNPKRLKAQLKIAETQAKDVQVGQVVAVDLRSNEVRGRVARVDPAVDATNGTVTVDVALEGDLPRGARPDLSVDGTIEIERLADVMYLSRPVHGQAHATVSLFKLVDGGGGAVRVNAKLGHMSVSDVEVIQGLNVGDQIVLSETQEWDAVDRLRVK